MKREGIGLIIKSKQSLETCRLLADKNFKKKCFEEFTEKVDNMQRGNFRTKCIF